MQGKNVGCFDVLCVVYVKGWMWKEVECLQIEYGGCVDAWLEVNEDLDCVQVVDVDYVDERLEAKEDVDCLHIGDVDCSYVRDVGLQC